LLAEGHDALVKFKEEQNAKARKDSITDRIRDSFVRRPSFSDKAETPATQRSEEHSVVGVEIEVSRLYGESA